MFPQWEGNGHCTLCAATAAWGGGQILPGVGDVTDHVLVSSCRLSLPEPVVRLLRGLQLLLQLLNLVGRPSHLPRHRPQLALGIVLGVLRLEPP